MRRAGTLILGAGLIAVALGCTRHFQYTAGVCDCDPEPVESVLQPYQGRPQALPVSTSPRKADKPAPPPVDQPRADQAGK